MRPIRRLQLVLTMLGTLIGAGFATGRELTLYFGDSGPLGPLLAGVCYGALLFVFAELGRLSGGQWEGVLLPGCPGGVRGVVRLANAAVFCAMVAGAEGILFRLLGVRFGGLVSALFCLGLVAHGKQGLNGLNTLLVPLLLGLFLLLSLYARPQAAQGFRPLSAPAYAAMNTLTAGALAGRLCAANTRRDNAVVALWVGGLFALLAVGVHRIALGFVGADMPLYALAERVGLAGAAGVLIFGAILTTMAGCLSVAAEAPDARAACGRAALWVAVGLLIAPVGFGALVEAVYPAVGAVGLGLSALGCVRLLLLSRKSPSPTPSPASSPISPASSPISPASPPLSPASPSLSPANLPCGMGTATPSDGKGGGPIRAAGGKHRGRIAWAAAGAAARGHAKKGARTLDKTGGV